MSNIDTGPFFYVEFLHRIKRRFYFEGLVPEPTKGLCKFASFKSFANPLKIRKF